MLRKLILIGLIAMRCWAQVKLGAIVAEGEALSPQGDRVAFSWCRGEFSDECGVSVRDVHGVGRLVLFEKGEHPHDLQWSPDGKWIAFLDYGNHSGVTLLVVSAGGGEAKRIDQIAWRYCWTADSKGFITTHTEDPDNSETPIGLRAVDLSGQVVGVIAREGTAPALSPDGSLLAFVRDEAIFVQPLGPAYQPIGISRRVAEQGNRGEGPIWIKGGKELLFSVAEPNPLRRVSIEEGSVPMVLSGIGDRTEVKSLTSDGAGRVAATLETSDRGLYRMDLRARSLRMERVRAVFHTEREFEVSPDGRKVAYISNGDLWISALGGSQARRLVGMARGLGQPLWSPDGTSIVFAESVGFGHGDDRTEIYIVGAAGGEPKRLLPSRDDFFPLRRSRDGNWLDLERTLQAAGEPLRREEWRLNLASNEVQPMLPTDRSGDGLVTDKLKRQIGHTFATGESVVYYPERLRGGGQMARMMRMNLATAKVEPIALLDFIPGTLQLSWDGLTLYATSDAPATTSRVIVEGLP